jgi:MFS family permease
MSGAAINIIVAPWFERRRGIAVSWAMNGASAGGIVVAPLLTLVIAANGFAAAIHVAVFAMLLVLVPAVLLLLRPKRENEHEPAVGIPSSQRPVAAGNNAEGHLPPPLAAVMRSREFVTVSLPSALGLTAQVGVLIHQVPFLSPVLGAGGAGWAVSLTTGAAVAGRVATGYLADRYDRRTVACGNFLVQALGLGLLLAAATPTVLFAGCLVFGLGVGNTTSLPGLLVQQEFPKQHFVRLVSVIVAINQFSFAFGPMLLGRLEQLAGSYLIGLAACLALEVLAAIIVISPVVWQRCWCAAATR